MISSTPEEIREWAKHPLTAAVMERFLEMKAERSDALRSAAALTTQEPGACHPAYYAGTLDILDAVLGVVDELISMTKEDDLDGQEDA